MSGELRTRLWYSTAFDPRSRKFVSVEHMEQVVGEYDTQTEATNDGDGRLDNAAAWDGRAHRPVVVPRRVADALLAYFRDPCRLDHDGVCQAHMLEDHCSIAALRKAVGDPPQG